MRIKGERKSEFDNGEPALLPAPAAWNAVGPMAPGRGDDKVWISHVTAIVWRRKLTIAGMTLLGLLIGLAATVLKTPVYRAQASVQVEGFNDTFLRDVTPISPLLANATAESYVRNQLNLVKSDRLAQRVADKLGIESRPVSNPTWLEQLARKAGLLPHDPPTAEQERILRVQSAMESRMVPNSHIIEVLYSARDPKLAAMGANAAADEFIALNRESRWQLAQDTTEWLTKQAADLKTKLERDSHRLQEYARSSGLMFAGDQQTVEHERMRQLQDALGKAEADQAAKQSRYEAALANTTESLPDQMVAGPLQRYLGELQTLKQERAQLRSMYTPAHYRVARVEAQIAELESAIEKERRAMVERLKTEYDAATRLQRLLATANSRQLAQLQVEGEKEAGYGVLKREVESTQQMYEAMLSRAKEAGIASALRTTNIRVIDPARAPSEPHSPNPALNLAAGLVFGLIGGVGLAFLRERSNVIKQPGDAIALNLPELGVIPSAKDDRILGRARGGLIAMPSGKPELALVTWQHDTSLLSESFRAALTSILFSSGLHDGGPPAGERRGAVLVVSSTDAMEGKTTVVSNLGAALAQAGRRVLLIDGDLRKPSLHKVFGMPNEDSGLTDLLRKAEPMEAVNVENTIKETAVPGLWVLPSGTGRDGIPKLLYAANLNALLQRFRSEFDLVLVDSPPMGLLTDARILGRLSDGVVLVVRANRARTDALRATCMRLLQDGIPVLGTILNDCRLDGSSLRPYSQYYRHYGTANGA